MRVRVALKEYVESQGRTLYWLSQKTGKQYASIWQFANGGREGVSFHLLETVCEALECEPGDILKLEKGKKRQAKTGRPRNEI